MTDVTAKKSRSGGIYFVTVQRDLVGDAGVFIEETRSIVYLATQGVERVRNPSAFFPDWTEDVALDVVQLFRFSALTFNAHRIHYDLSYATEVEGYPERVVHGPLQALLLAYAAQSRAPGPLTEFEFRGTAPAFLGDRLTLAGRAPKDGEMTLEIHAPDGTATTRARAKYTD